MEFFFEKIIKNFVESVEDRGQRSEVRSQESRIRLFGRQ